MADYADLDQASPALTGTPSTIAPVPTAAQPTTFEQILKAIAGMSGGSRLAPFAPLGQAQGTSPNTAIPLYTPPLQALPTAEDEQKQTSAGQVAQYAKIIAALFGGGAGAAGATGAGAQAAGMGF